MSTIKEATFRHQGLTSEKTEILLAQLHNLKALNLSQNKLEFLPRGIPNSLIALDLSFNLFTSFPGSERLSRLIELKLSSNDIESTIGLASACSLEYLDLSNNHIKIVLGLESLKNLKSLQLEDNDISTAYALRSLSLNRELSELVLRGNPLAAVKNYKILVLGFVLSIKRLDGKLCKNRIKNSNGGYTEGFTTKSKASNIVDSNTDNNKIPPNNALLYSKIKDNYKYKERINTVGKNESIYIDGNDGYIPRNFSHLDMNNDYDPFAPVIVRSPVPWRNPPMLLPRDRKGQPVFGVTGEYTSLDGTTSTSTMHRNFSTIDMSSKYIISSSTGESGFYGSPGKSRGTTKSLKNEQIVFNKKEQEYDNSQQWSTPLLYKDSKLQEMESENKIINKLSPFALSSPNRFSSHSFSSSPMRNTTSKDTCNNSNVYNSNNKNDKNSSENKNVDGSLKIELLLKQQKQQQLQQINNEQSYIDNEDKYVVDQRENSKMDKALSEIESMWHKELIEEAKNMSKSDYTEQSKEHYSHREHSVMTELDINDGGNDRYKTTFLSTATSLSPTSDRQNKASILRALYNQDLLNSRHSAEKVDHQRRQPPPSLPAGSVDWGHHHRSGKSPAYRQQIKKNTEQKDTKYDKILERANQFVKDTRNNDDNNIKKTYNLNSENNNADKPSQEENNDYYNDNNSTFITEQNEDNYENSFDTTDNDNYDNNQYFYSTNENNDFEKSDHNYKDGSECNSGNRTDSLYAKYHRQQLLSKQAKESREKLKELPAPVEGLSRNRTYRDASYPPPVPHLPQSPQSSINYNYPNAANANEYTDAGSHSSNPSHYKVPNPVPSLNMKKTKDGNSTQSSQYPIVNCNIINTEIIENSDYKINLNDGGNIIKNYEAVTIIDL